MVQKHPILLTRSTRHADNMHDRSQLGERPSNGIDGRELADAERGADGAQATKASISVCCISYCEEF